MYKYVEGISMADVAFEAEGKTLEELFTSSALALEEVQVDLKTVKPVIEHEINVEAASADNLLFNFLEELVFLKDAEQLLLVQFTIKIAQEKNKLTLHCVANGEAINLKNHKLGQDIKAVTLHQFKVEQTKTGWKALVVLDI
jgi:SHS2 domain-containing protein